MARHADDMTKVPSPGEIVPEGWYHVKFDSVKEDLSKESGNPVVLFNLKIQNEPMVGRVIFDTASLQAHALFKLKAYYEACDIELVPGQGHDPEELQGRECYVKVTHEVYKGETRANIKPFNIKKLGDPKVGTLGPEVRA